MAETVIRRVGAVAAGVVRVTGKDRPDGVAKTVHGSGAGDVLVRSVHQPRRCNAGRRRRIVVGMCRLAALIPVVGVGGIIHLRKPKQRVRVLVVSGLAVLVGRAS